MMAPARPASGVGSLDYGLPYSPPDQRDEVIQREWVVRRVERLHVPFVDETAREIEPGLLGELVPWVRLARRHLLPVPSGKSGVVADDLHNIGTDVWLE